VGFVTGAKGIKLDTDSLLSAANGQLGKTQRLSTLYQIDEMPRSHIGKLLKTDLREIAERMVVA
jgi:acyl-coenzyme A synthetase/AMP-(fatty) acid ligase